MVSQEKLKCSSCGTSLINVVVTKVTEDVSKVQAQCWKCSGTSFERAFQGKYSIVGTTKSIVVSMRIDGEKILVHTQKKERSDNGS
jgi:hypothetical protein